MRLIDAKALENEILLRVPLTEKQVNSIKFVINKASTIEAKPVVHAHWKLLGVSNDKKIYECSNCKSHICGTGKFCKECGAQMTHYREVMKMTKNKLRKLLEVGDTVYSAANGTPMIIQAFDENGFFTEEDYFYFDEVRELFFLTKIGYERRNDQWK